MGNPLEHSWFPDAMGDDVLLKRCEEAFRLSKNYGHQEIPTLLPHLEDGEVDSTMLPWKRFNAQTWETLIEAYALADL